jgi:hypothetical protein
MKNLQFASRKHETEKRRRNIYRFGDIIEVDRVEIFLEGAEWPICFRPFCAGEHLRTR